MYVVTFTSQRGLSLPEEPFQRFHRIFHKERQIKDLREVPKALVAKEKASVAPLCREGLKTIFEWFDNASQSIEKGEAGYPPKSPMRRETSIPKPKERGSRSF